MIQKKGEKSEKEDNKEDDRNKNVIYKSMKVSNMAKQLEAILNRPPSMGMTSDKKEETPIVHSTVDLAEDNSENNNNTLSYGRASRRKKAQKKFEDN